MMSKLLCIVGLCGGVSAFAPDNSIEDVPYDKSHITRRLTTVTVSNFNELETRLAGSATEIVVADGDKRPHSEFLSVFLILLAVFPCTCLFSLLYKSIVQ